MPNDYHLGCGGEINSRRCELDALTMTAGAVFIDFSLDRHIEVGLVYRIVEAITRVAPNANFL